MCAGSAATGRLAEVVQRLAPPAAADVLTSMLTRDVPFKLQVLAALDYNERMGLALGLVQKVSFALAFYHVLQSNEELRVACHSEPRVEHETDAFVVLISSCHMAVEMSHGNVRLVA